MAHNWDHIASELRGEFRVIAIDLSSGDTATPRLFPTHSNRLGGLRLTLTSLAATSPIAFDREPPSALLHATTSVHGQGGNAHNCQ